VWPFSSFLAVILLVYLSLKCGSASPSKEGLRQCAPSSSPPGPSAYIVIAKTELYRFILVVELPLDIYALPRSGETVPRHPFNHGIAAISRPFRLQRVQLHFRRAVTVGVTGNLDDRAVIATPIEYLSE